MAKCLEKPIIYFIKSSSAPPPNLFKFCRINFTLSTIFYHIKINLLKKIKKKKQSVINEIKAITNTKKTLKARKENKSVK